MKNGGEKMRRKRCNADVIDVHDKTRLVPDDPASRISPASVRARSGCTTVISICRG
jgi:hypothetical protein